MNPNLTSLLPYPFERLNDLKKGLKTDSDREHVSLSLGEPKHTPPEFLLDALSNRKNLLNGITSYPVTRGGDELRTSIAEWIRKRYDVITNPDTQILPVNGTREGLFSFAQCVLSGKSDRWTLLPNPFYQIYEGASFLRGTRPHYVPATEQIDFDVVPEEVWNSVELAYICSPGNPSGCILDLHTLQQLIEKSHRYGFVIASDECYSELYNNEGEPPPGLLQAASSMGYDDFRNCVAFNSLSKRSNCPGLRSGFVAGDATILESFYLYRTYHGCAMPQHVQDASALLWNDEEHVVANRAVYRAKFDAVRSTMIETFGADVPDGAFYYWPDIAMDDQRFARELFLREHITVLPGTYVSREVNGSNPGSNRIRLALVAPLAECVDAVERLCQTHAELLP